MNVRFVTGVAAGLSAVVLTTLSLPPATTAARASAAADRSGGVQVTDRCLRSVPEPGSDEKVKICYTIFKPAGASRRHKVPFIIHSHGWGGSRITDPANGTVTRYLDAGYGVLSFDQRGFGESGGYAHVENPRIEGRDNLRLVRRIARLPWVRKDGPGDPRLGAIGGSYGGGFQFLSAFMHLQRRGKPVFDALAPEITWNDLTESLGPEGVPRAEWASALGVAAQPSNALEPKVVAALAEGTTTGNWPDGSGPSGIDMTAYFRRNGPSWHAAHGRRLDIPVLLGQGATDTLFDLRQGIDNWRTALTRRARKRSIFVGYNGGHVLPSVVPPWRQESSDPCSIKLGSPGFADLALRFMDEELKGKDRRLRGHGRFHLATQGGTCTTVRSVRPDTSYDVGTVATPEVAGPWLATKVVDGPVRIAGASYLTGRLTTVGLTNRAFYGLAIGTSPLDATLVQNNVLPLNVQGVVEGKRHRVKLPAVAVDVPKGQSLFVIASAESDTFVGMQSRTPGVVLLEDTVAHLPVVGR